MEMIAFMFVENPSQKGERERARKFACVNFCFCRFVAMAITVVVIFRATGAHHSVGNSVHRRLTEVLRGTWIEAFCIARCIAAYAPRTMHIHEATCIFTSGCSAAFTVQLYNAFGARLSLCEKGSRKDADPSPSPPSISR